MVTRMIASKLKRKGFQAKEQLLGYKNLCKNFKHKVGYELNLKNPRSFNEKINWKKIYDRNPLIPLTADKFRVRDYVKKTLGEKEGEEVLIPLLFVTENPSDISFNDLPGQFVIKANHASGRIRFVKDKRNINTNKIIDECTHWLKVPCGFYQHEWAYQPIPRKIIIEKYITDHLGRIPRDYKFYLFNGTCKLVHVDFDRFNGHTRSFFKPVPWERITGISQKVSAGKNLNEPKNLQRMLEIAEELAKKFDFVRVDLYSIDDKVYFGELTHYPESGFSPFHPELFDFTLGKEWNLIEKYWLK